MKPLTAVVLLLLFALVQLPNLAQTDACPVIVQSALEAADAACEDIGRNQLCYGHFQLAIEPRPSAQPLRFAQEGDRVSVADLETLHLSAWDLDSRAWGVALMRLQANLPETMPGQNVLFVLFGAVEITNAVDRDEREYSPMQAFYLQTGLGDAPCASAPDSGLLVQTPEGAADIEFTVNDVQITLGSTAYLQAQPGAALTVYVVEGQAQVEAFGTTVPVPEGAQVAIPLDEDLAASGAPGAVHAYKEASVEYLPLLLLDRPIELAAPCPADDLVAAGVVSCDVVMTQAVNIRTGPGTNYPIEARATVGQTFHYVGQVEGSDGYIWYLTACGFWVREDLIPTDCSFLPPVP